jgi:hypothetical protein
MIQLKITTRISPYNQLKRYAEKAIKIKIRSGFPSQDGKNCKMEVWSIIRAIPTRIKLSIRISRYSKIDVPLKCCNRHKKPVVSPPFQEQDARPFMAME